ncbi:MAG: type II secretion system protein GspL [Paracoccaceae bacterium]|nr:type II secretion system protein GspL [Paracoccaceae bacterium]
MTARSPIPCHALGDSPARGRHVALVPGADVPLLTLDLPDGLRGSAREDVARRQLRDRIGAGDGTVELRPFHAPGDSDGWNRALVADAAQLHTWRGLTGKGCQAVLPDYLALPAAEGLWVLRQENGSVQARLGLEDGFSADPDLAWLMLEEALESATPKPQALLLLEGADWAAPLATSRDIAVIHDPAAAGELGLATPVVLGHGELSFDLRADPRAARASLRRRVLPWRWPLMAGLLAAGLWGGAQFVTMQRLEAEARSVQAETLAVVRESFVPTGPVLDIRTQVSRALADRQAAARDWQGRVSALTLLAQAAQVINAGGAVSETYRYDETGLQAVLRLNDFAAAETLVADLRAAGLSVAVDDLRVSDGTSGVRAELRLEATP